MNYENQKTILLVEDEAIIGIVVSKALQRFGYKVITATSGEKAVEITEGVEKIDLILMDINLGEGIDGTEAARQILAEKNIPIVFHTSHSEREMVEKVRNITRYGYVVKSSGDFVLQSSMEMAFDLYNSHEEARKESLRSQTILRTIPDMMFVVDSKGFFKDFSGSSDSDSLALPSEVIIGNNINVLFSADEVQKLLALFRKCIETGDIQNYIYTLDIDNEPHIYDLRIAKLDDEEVLAIVRDITERKRAEVEIKNKTEEFEAANEELNAAMEEMEAANEELIAVNEDLLAKDRAILSEKIFIEALLESIPGYLYVYDENGNLIRWNKKHETMTGYSAEELSHMNMSDWFEGEDAVRVAAAVDEVFRTGYGEVEANLLIKGGGKLLIRSNGVKLTIDGKTYFTGVGIDISERKMTEDALKGSELSLSLLLQSLPVPVFYKDLQGRYTGFNQAFEAFFGAKKEDLIGKNVFDVNPLELAEIYHKQDSVLFEKAGIQVYESQVKNARGELRDVVFHKGSIKDVSGNITGLIGVVLDITERKQAEDALLKSENKLETMLQTMVDGMVTVDLNGQITYSNQAAQTILGIGKDILGKYYQSREWMQIDGYGNPYPEDKLPLAVALKEQRIVVDLQHQIAAKDGERKWLSVNAAPLFNSSGQLVGGIASFREITELKCAEEALKIAEETYRNLFLNSQIGLFRSEVESGLMLDANDTLARFAGYENRESILAVNYNIAEQYVDKEERKRMISLLKQNREIFNFEARFWRKDGSIIWIRLSAKHIKDKDWLEGVAEDITERKMVEDEIKLLFREKEILLKETHHRVKNNMNTIYGLLTLQSDAMKDEECKAILHDSALRIKKMMILYDKLYRSDNYNEMSIKDFLEPLISEVLGLFSYRAFIKAEVDIEDFILNSKMLSPVGIIINEFITNSIKYAFNDKESGIISISAKRKENVVTVIYGDNGAGLPASVTFENSTGFGMQLAGMLTGQIGGSIRIERGEGTRFVLEFEAV